MPRVGPCKGSTKRPACRTVAPVPNHPTAPDLRILSVFGASDPKIFPNSGLRPEFGFWASEITGFSVVLCWPGQAAA